MLVEVKVPVLSESVAEATLVAWHKKIGEAVKRSENLIDIETDKVVMELPAPKAGVLKEIRKPDGATVTSGEVIAVIDTDAVAEETQASEMETKPITDIQPKKPIASTEKTIAANEDSQTAPVLMPAARKLAADLNLNSSDVARLKGTGLGGVFLKKMCKLRSISKRLTQPNKLRSRYRNHSLRHSRKRFHHNMQPT